MECHQVGHSTRWKELNKVLECSACHNQCCNQKQTDITTGKQIRHLRTQSGMTQEELAGELNVTRQALSNWERDVNEPDLNTLKKICFLFGVHMDDFAKEVITKMETCEKKRNDNLISMIWQLDFFMVSGYFLALVFSLLAVL